MSNNNNKNKQPLDSGEIGLVEKRSTSTPREKNEASTSTPSLRDVDTINFLLDCAKKGETFADQRSLLICKASRVLRDHSESSFEPQLVSIGPLHSEDPKLKEFEWLKDVYLNDLLNRCKKNSTPRETLLEACLREVKTLIPEIRESYAGMIEKYCTDDKLARMMIMDGCFILEFCLKHEERSLHSAKKEKNVMQANRIAMDLMLLENQVPFFVLQTLFEYMVKGKVNVSTLGHVLDKYLSPYVMKFCSLFSKEILTAVSFCDRDLMIRAKVNVFTIDKYDHVLGYMHKRCQLVFKLKIFSIRADQTIPEASEHVNEERIAFHSIVELDRSGMNFKPHPEGNWSTTIQYQPSRFPCLPWFWGKPTLLMPTLVINDSTELILRNLIAYEQLLPEERDCFTSYAVAMDILINTEEDIAKLVESKVLVNRLGSNQEAADMFNKICKNTFVTDIICYTEEFKQMDKYYNRFWPKNIARLRRVYFSNPWSIIALVAAIIVSLATVVATIFAVLDYYR